MNSNEDRRRSKLRKCSRVDVSSRYSTKHAVNMQQIFGNFYDMVQLKPGSAWGPVTLPVFKTGGRRLSAAMVGSTPTRFRHLYASITRIKTGDYAWRHLNLCFCAGLCYCL